MRSEKNQAVFQRENEPYFSERVTSIRIDNNHHLLDWLRSELLRGIDIYTAINGLNYRKLRKLFGNPFPLYSAEWNVIHTWRLEFKRHVFFVYYAKGRGTSYEIVVEDRLRHRFANSERYGTLCIDFLKTHILGKE